jgi:hypothetical protein
MNTNTDNDKQIELEQTHGKGVRFTGEVIAEASGHRVGGKEQSRYTDLTLYRTKAGKYILFIEHITCWEGEQNTSTLHVCDDAHRVFDVLSDGEGLGRLDTLLLQRAAKNDPAFERVITEEVE